MIDPAFHAAPRSRRRSPWRCRWGAALVVALLLAADLAPAVADSPLHEAGVVVRHGDGRLTYAHVTFPEESISGIELLRRSTIPLVTVSFGGLGDGVCSLAGEGCDTGECRRQVCQGPRPDDPYWQYFRQEAAGEWRWLVLGPSATVVHDGDIDGWSWTGGDSGLPALAIADMARLAGADPRPGEPGAVVRTIVPPAIAAAPEASLSTPLEYLGALLILTGIAGSGLVVVRRCQARATI